MGEHMCADCGVDTEEIGELYYMVHDHVWEHAWPRTGWYREGREYRNRQGYFILCIGCLENRLGRELIKEDFLEGYIGYAPNSSARLLKKAGVWVTDDACGDIEEEGG